jgi:hypothetical protein
MQCCHTLRLQAATIVVHCLAIAFAIEKLLQDQGYAYIGHEI